MLRKGGADKVTGYKGGIEGRRLRQIYKSTANFSPTFTGYITQKFNENIARKID